MTAVASLLHPIAGPITFKIATERDELEQVHQLNYRTFVEEIPQHRGNAERALVDKFHDQNTYFVARHGSRVIGMIAFRDKRPFSLDAKLPHLDSFLPAGFTVCEARLLAVEPGYRNGVVFRGLVEELTRHGVARGYNAAVISGAVRQQRLYEHMGFVPFGPRVGDAAAQYQPMYVTLDALTASAGAALARGSRRRSPALSFMPGPVDLHPRVKQALAAHPISHRDDPFVAALQRTKKLLRRLTSAPRVEILVGTGTIANDVVAAQLAARREPGLILSNGEFGERLIDHAERAELRFDAVRLEWGAPFSADVLDKVLSKYRSARWCWMVHHETSTGVLNYLAHATYLCNMRGIRLAADCVSSIGLVPVDLSGVYLATSVSGKALASAPGLALVFHQGDARPVRAPRYLDLSLYAEADGVPFTMPSQQLDALRVAAEHALERDFVPVRAARDGLHARSRRRERGTRDDHDRAPEGAEDAVAGRRAVARRVRVELPERISARAKLDSDRPDGRVLAGESRAVTEGTSC
jgi:aspartate aminotransferase-like enzyme/predicted N-acetyltransferase YhbS